MRTTFSNKFLFVFSILLLLFLIFAFVYADGSAVIEKKISVESGSEAGNLFVNASNQ
jgi:Flp pilus assembly protein TadG